ncbi:MAG: hypothetical protein U9O50_08370 [Acidobacteriota bacterium]|nr:hypothetical protein [Acidobacteriota bacterium]
MSWLDNLKGDNFLAVLDVMLDIKQEIDIKADYIQIPILQTKVRFHKLLPIDSFNMRDKYCNLRWKATGFLQKNGIIKNFKIIQGTHRWHSYMSIDLNEKSFNEEFEKIYEEYKRRMESQMDIEEKKEKRFRFLYLLYQRWGKNPHEYPNMYSLGKQLGFSKSFTHSICSYLNGKEMIEIMSRDGIVKILQPGIEEVENALSKPDEPTEHFPPVKNIIIIKEVTDSQIQIDSPHSIQIKADKELTDKLEELNKFIKDNIEQLMLNEDDKQELQTEIQTIDIQLSSPKPKRNILKECVSSIRRIMEGATGQIIASQIIDKLGLIENLF